MKMEIMEKEMLHSCMNQCPSPFRFAFLHLALFSSWCSSPLMGRAWKDFRRLQTGQLSLMGGLCLSFYVCSRDLMELRHTEGEKTELQYASWGPQGNQLVSKALAYFPYK